VQPALATPITGTSRWPRFTMACRAGKIILYARSPVAPKKTSTSEFVTIISLSGLGRAVGFFQGSAKLKAHRGQKFVGEVPFAPRTESLVKRASEDGCRHCFVNCGFNGPASFPGVRKAAGK